MLRGLFTTASVLSLVLCVATLALWARSYDTNDWLNQDGLDCSRTIYSAGGRILYLEQDDSAMTKMGLLQWHGPAPRWRYAVVTDPECPKSGDATWLSRLGMAIEWNKREPIHMFFSARPIIVARTLLILPHWLFASLFVMLPAWRLVTSVRVRVRCFRAAARGLCATCGYDLRASKDRCPECGGRIREDREPGARSSTSSGSGPLFYPAPRNMGALPDQHFLPMSR